ncbi:phage tail protein [Microbulbifer sp. OS29]|uniref:Phage tail protein n=1 Tax=Microbulbifer okhotskensis TaxID=2926617 RepID=A0A9X2ETC8_9GAMM|nr:tail fiber protein [Microbulbifer okhotskensis]MCO1335193.1 phage tail protein [Microbulbifer okhotskensis]
MPIEDANYISELDSNNPAQGDPAGSGDDHLRILKKAIKNTFPNLSGPIDLNHEEINELPDSITQGISEAIDALSIIPIGAIVMWSGDTVPENWVLCDGENGAPDLRDRFIVGAGSDYNVGSYGGAKTKYTSETGGHDHSGKTGGTAITVDQMPSHNHGYAGQVLVYPGNESSSFGPDYDPSDKDGKTASLQSEGGGEVHDHAIDAGGEHKHTVDVRPPYYGLAFIMKVS